jgi:glycosyltransferase involved in cell wall biosynthesis
MIKGQNIICFGSEIWNYPGFQQNTMRLLSSENRVLFVKPIGTRKISLNASNFQVYFARFSRVLKLFQKNNGDGADEIKNVTICDPWVIPLVYNAAITRINRVLIARQFSRLIDALDFNAYILWVGTPTAAFALDLFNPTGIIYNPVDKYSEFSFVDREKILAYERDIASRADAIICTADAIRDSLIPYNQKTFTVTHGVNVKHFRSALGREDIPADIKNIKRPIIGFFGGLNDWVNVDLLRRVAGRFTDASIVLIGRVWADLSELARMPNVHILGYKQFDSLPAYVKHFDVCMIPYIINERLLAVDPIKLREYLSLGKPVVSVNLPEVRKLEKLVYVAESDAEFVSHVEKALDENDPTLTAKRVQAARESDWSIKIDEISGIVDAAIRRRKSAHNLDG